MEIYQFIKNVTCERHSYIDIGMQTYFWMASLISYPILRSILLNNNVRLQSLIDTIGIVWGVIMLGLISLIFIEIFQIVACAFPTNTEIKP